MTELEPWGGLSSSPAASRPKCAGLDSNCREAPGRSAQLQTKRQWRDVAGRGFWPQHKSRAGL